MSPETPKYNHKTYRSPPSTEERGWLRTRLVREGARLGLHFGLMVLEAPLLRGSAGRLVVSRRTRREDGDPGVHRCIASIVVWSAELLRETSRDPPNAGCQF